MRKKVVAGNWKMNKNLSEAANLISELKNEAAKVETDTEIIICPPYISLDSASALIENSSIKLGAQNMNENDSGAFTAEISADMLLSAGVEYVILGHSERRSIYNESDELINKKIKKAFEKGLKPIFCVGETLEQRESGVTEKVIESQLLNGLKDISQSDFSNLIIAYEPVWAIGTGKTASPDQANSVHEFIRKVVSDLYSPNAAENIIIQYGGSVKPDNASELLSMPNIDGALVGGACLKADSFIEIIKKS